MKFCKYVALAALALVVAPHSARAQHDSGLTTFSLGGTLAHTRSYDKNYTRQSETTDEYGIPEYVEDKRDYGKTDLTIYLSGGYFVIDHLEFGLSGSLMYTWYSSTNVQSDFEMYDVLLYGKYYFDNSSSLTPYLKLQGGYSFMETGSYMERSPSGGGVLGLEYYGLGPVSFFAELSSIYTERKGDLSGSEWKNQLYLGFSFYFDFFKDPDYFLMLQPDTRKQIKSSNKRWGDLLKAIDEELEAEFGSR